MKKKNKQLKKLYSINLGCKVNLFETNSVINNLVIEDFVLINDINQADLVLINTCSVTNNADKKSKHFINQACKLVNKPIIIVMGCFSQMNVEWFKNKANIIIGNKYKNNIPQLLKQYLKDKKQIIKIKL